MSDHSDDPDLAPVTRGELRQVLELVVAYQMQVSLLMSLLIKFGGDETNSNVVKAKQQAERLFSDLERKAGGLPGVIGFLDA